MNMRIINAGWNPSGTDPVQNMLLGNLKGRLVHPLTTVREQIAHEDII